MNLIKKQPVLTTLILLGFMMLSGCVSLKTLSFSNNDAHSQYPAWLNEMPKDSSEKENNDIEYISKEKQAVDAATNKRGLLFDYLNTSLDRLDDYSAPKKAVRSTSRKKKTGRKASSAKRYLSKLGSSWSGSPTGNKNNGRWDDGDNVNIVINNPIDDKPTPKYSQKEELSRIESLFNKYGELTRGKKLRQFGYELARFKKSSGGSIDKNFDLIRNKRGAYLKSQENSTKLFSTSKSDYSEYQSDEYSLLRPVLSDYVMAPGDEVFVKITGPTEIAEVYSVDRNGQLFIPQVGAINLAGRKASELQTLVNNKVKENFNGAYVEASLGRLRSIQVTVTGHIHTPGLIQVPANSSMFNALVSAGGPVKNGSLRNITLRRRGSEPQVIDLYSLLLDGDWQQDPVLLPNDIIHIGPIGSTVAILSPGNNGWIYEIKKDSILSDLTAKTGVARSFTDIETVLIERNAVSTDREIETIDFSQEAANFKMTDGDIFQFFPTHPHSYNNVNVSGPVLRPGTYPYKNSMRVSDLLGLTRGFLVQASLDKVLIIRELGVDKRFDIMPKDNRGSHRKQLIWIDLAKILAGDKEADIHLARLDRLKIFTINDQQPEPTLRIIGGVRKPGEYRLTANMTLGDLLSIAGGPSEKAYDGESTIVRRKHSSDGKRHFDVGLIPFNLKDVLAAKKSAGILLKNNDKIVIRQVNNLEVSAKIDGWVQFPGTYILPSGSKIIDLIRVAGGILDGADLRGSVFKRRRVSNIENRQLQGFYSKSTERFARVRDEVTLAGHPSESLANQLSLLGQDRLYANMGKFQTTGRIVIDLTSDSFLETDDNLILEDGDSLLVPQKMTTVMVMGRIFNPSAYLWKNGLSVEKYLDKSGGYLEDADEDHVYVVMANGEVKSAAQKGGRADLLSFVPHPGDIVFVPQKTLGRSTMAQVVDVLNLLRMTAETGMISAALPHVSKTATSIDLSSSGHQQRSIVEEFRPELYELERQNLINSKE